MILPFIDDRKTITYKKCGWCKNATEREYLITDHLTIRLKFNKGSVTIGEYVYFHHDCYSIYLESKEQPKKEWLKKAHEYNDKIKNKHK